MPPLADALNEQPKPDTLAYWLRPFTGYLDRQRKLAQEGSDYASQGSEAVQRGDMSGLAGMLLGPMNYLTSPINALLPEEQATRDFGRSLGGSTGEALAASGLGLAAIAMPGPDVGKGAKFADEAAEGITAYHGSPHTFDKFSMDKIGTGEGAQAYGHGLYFAGHEPVAKGYRDTLSKETLRTANGDVFDPQSLEHMSLRVAANKNGTDLDATIARAKEVLASANDQTRPMAERDLAKLSQLKAVGGVSPNTGSMYQVRLAVKPDELLDWDKPLSEQSKTVQDVVKQFPEEFRMLRDPTGAPAPQYGEPLGHEFYKKVASDVPQHPNFNTRNPTQATDRLKAAGIKGIRYKDAGSRTVGDAAKIVENYGGDRAKALAVAEDRLKKASLGDLKYWDGIVKDLNRQETYNYVIFDDSLVSILKRYAIPFTLGAGGAAIVSGANMPEEIAAQLGPQA